MSKRTLEGSHIKKVRKSGFRSRSQTPTGSRILRSRRKKGRKILAKY
uniref:Ribosomal protein L34 n=1 Tax=Cyanophora biloba TaxID=1489483 RepID=A0A2Z4HGM4_9EUKA|nr:ribosomal protein L34 [Cyanophora biloba]AWW13882.1 ribosomal protein L34 [Cyanophora biloba]